MPRPLRCHLLVSYVEIQAALHSGEEGLWEQRVFLHPCVTRGTHIRENACNACKILPAGSLHKESALTGGKGRTTAESL